MLFTGVDFCGIIQVQWEKDALYQGHPQEGENIVAVSKSQQKAVHKYVKANYDRMELTVPKGRKELIKAHAEAHSESVNGFINRAIQETMERDNDVAGPFDGRTGGKAEE